MPALFWLLLRLGIHTEVQFAAQLLVLVAAAAGFQQHVNTQPDGACMQVLTTPYSQGEAYRCLLACVQLELCS
jgi:hypothetical protein